MDQKLLSSILADSLAKVMPDIIDLDQTGFITNRQLSDVRHTLNIIEYVQENNRQALILTFVAGFSNIIIYWLHAISSGQG